MSQVNAVAERIEVPNALAERLQPATQLTPIQMAYQLLSNGHDLGAVKEMISFGKELEADAAKKAFSIAMAEAQAEMMPVATNANNPQTRSRYASYDQLDRAIRPIYTKHGFGLSFDEADSPKPDHIRLICEVTHIAGHTKTYHRDMPADGKGAKGGDVMTKTHAAGAAASYGMRYILRGVFNIAVGEGDTDGNAPTASITEQQVMDLNDLIDSVVEEISGNRPAFAKSFLQFMKAERIEAIAAKDYQKAVNAINASRTAR